MRFAAAQVVMADGLRGTAQTAIRQGLTLHPRPLARNILAAADIGKGKVAQALMRLETVVAPAESPTTRFRPANTNFSGKRLYLALPMPSRGTAKLSSPHKRSEARRHSFSEWRYRCVAGRMSLIAVSAVVSAGLDVCFRVIHGTAKDQASSVRDALQSGLPVLTTHRGSPCRGHLDELPLFY